MLLRLLAGSVNELWRRLERVRTAILIRLQSFPAEAHPRDVYGVARDLPINYVERKGVDGLFVASLAREKHIVVFGSSKQGKTSLRKHGLHDDDYIVVTCSNKWTTLAAIHTAAGYTVEQATTKTAEGNFKITATAGGKAGIPFVAEGKVGGEGSYERKAGESVTTIPLELDPGDVNDIIAALAKIDFNKFIVLEDFHYLPDEAQQDFAVVLKAFHEHSKLTFIVVGVWLDENRLIQFNGDLTERVIAVNVEFDSDFRTGLINGCFESVSVVQVACHKVCEDAGVLSTADQRTIVGQGVDAAQVIRDVVDKQSARYNTFLQNFAGGFQETQLEMYRWLLLPVLVATPTALEAGLPYGHIRRTINTDHSTGEVNPGNITQALKSTASLQVKHGIKPIILDYDQSTRRLNVVDRGFLIWLGRQDRGDLLADAALPDPADKQLPLPDTT